MTLRKPHKACDLEEQHLRFPLIAMPKLDGVRGLVQEGRLYSRTLKPHPNLHCQKILGKPEFNGLDGELILGDPVAPLQCITVGSAVGTIKGEPDVQLWAFDWLHGETVDLSYHARLLALHDWHKMQEDSVTSLVRLVPYVLVYTLEQMIWYEQKWLEEGYEGIIVRDPNGKHKQGRSTARENGYLRRKPWRDSECCILSIEEGNTNNNPAELNELGLTKRSSHKANLVPNGKIGSMLAQDVYSGMEFQLSTGIMTEKQREDWFRDPTELLANVHKYRAVMYGMKDKPRFAQWYGIRQQSEM